MSVTVTAFPYLLFAIGLDKKDAVSIDDKKDIEEILNGSIETNITDKNTLVKTLEEYGAVNIRFENDNIYCDCDEFHIDFHAEPAKPYLMKISYINPDKMKEFVQDLNSEYCLNAQEISYNKIKERLEAQNLTIDEEDISDDNTIILTVNLE